MLEREAGSDQWIVRSEMRGGWEKKTNLHALRFNLKTAVGREKAVQAIDAHREFENCVVKLQVMSQFLHFRGASRGCADFRDPIAVFRFNLKTAVGRKKTVQAIDVQREWTNCVVTLQVISQFLHFLGASRGCADFRDLTAVLRLTIYGLWNAAGGILPQAKKKPPGRNTCLGAELRAREIITSHFRIPFSGHLGSIFTCTILSVGLSYACGCAHSDQSNLP